MTDLRLAPIGHNLPPALAEALAESLRADHAGLIERAVEIELAAASLPAEVESADDLAKVNAHVVGRRALAREIETTRKDAKQPYLDATRAVDGFFDPLKTRLLTGATAVEDRGKVYLRKVAAEEAQRRQAAALQAQRDADAARAREQQAKAEGDAASAKAASKDVVAFERQAERQETAAAQGLGLSRTAGGGAAAKLAKVWKWRITEPMKLLASLGPLGSWIAEPAVHAALDKLARGYDTIQRDIPGVEFYADEQVKTTALRSKP